MRATLAVVELEDIHVYHFIYIIFDECISFSTEIYIRVVLTFCQVTKSESIFWQNDSSLSLALAIHPSLSVTPDLSRIRLE